MQLEALSRKLEGLGLSEKQARVYVAALFLGPAPVQRIAEQAGVNRATAYVILDELIALGLVSESSAKTKTMYVAESPEALQRLIEREEQAVQEKREKTKELLPELAGMQRAPLAAAPIVRFYRGKEGVKSISEYLRRKAKPKTTIYALNNFDEVVKIFPDIFTANPKARLAKNIASKLFYFYKDEILSDKTLLRSTKRLPYPVLADINLYEDRAALLTYSDDPKKLTGILIESPEIVGALRQLFELAWEAQERDAPQKSVGSS